MKREMKQEDQGAPGGASQLQALIDSYVEGRIPHLLALVVEARRLGLADAAELLDAKAEENTCGASMDEGERARMWGTLARVAEKWADAIRGLAEDAAEPPNE